MTEEQIEQQITYYLEQLEIVRKKEKKIRDELIKLRQSLK